jgi:hypothetical protein
VTAEAVAVAAAGGVLTGATWSAFGLTWPGAVVGALNGAISGGRGIYEWRRVRGPLAFVLDSTWASITTTGSVLAHGFAYVQPGPAGYVHDLSRRANRHVYERGFVLRRGFLLTIGNVVSGGGPRLRTSARRRKVVTDHEDVHVWQARWLGPLFPLLYVGWAAVGAAAGVVVWAVRRRDQPFGRVVETCSYYMNPLEWWAYSRDGQWPPEDKVPGLGWTMPLVRPLSEKASRRRAAPVQPAPPAMPG